MPLQLEHGADAALQAGKTEFADLVAKSGLLLPQLAAASTLAFSTGHRHYEFLLSPSATARSLAESVRECGWRFLLHAGERGVVAAVDIRTDGRGGARIGALSAGPRLGAFVAALGWAEAAVASDETAFEPALVEVPALHFSALWLRSRDPARDRVLALAPGFYHERLPPRTLLREGHFIAAVEKLAQRRIAELPPAGAEPSP